MKILHTADWHLGKKLDSFSRMEEQVKVMQEIIAIADEQAVDMVLIAGDLFDTFNPPVEAVELFYTTLKKLSKNGRRPVIAISGNHDSPNFIDAPDPLAKACGIILIGKPNVMITPYTWENFKIIKTDKGFIEIQMDSFDYPIRILHTAYANEVRLKENLGEDKETQLNLILQHHWHETANQYCDEKGVNLLMTHLYMNPKGAKLLDEPDGEKPLKIGNADLIYTEAIPKKIQYTALGHLHGFRNIGTDQQPIVYASSPLCYSFSEAGQTKYVNIVSLQPQQNPTYEKRALQSGRPLKRISFDDVDKAVDWLNEHPNALVELTIESETFLKASDRKRLYQAHDGIIYLIPISKAIISNTDQETHTINLQQEIPALFRDYFKSKNNQEPNDDIMNLFNEIINA